MVPVGMSEAAPSDVLPAYNIEVMCGIRHYVVENVREARRFIRRCLPEADISAMTFSELNRHTPLEEVSAFLEPLRQGEPMGVMSDAGCPAVADPGALVAAIAQREGFRVVPLVGPSSILMSLMASGFNGQGFAFNGYLPIEEGARAAELRRLEAESRRRDMTQIFIETPYRNEKLLGRICETLAPDTALCVACDITSPENESIITRKVSEWKRWLAGPGNAGAYAKRPAIFLIYAGDSRAVQQGKHGASRQRGSSR